MLLTAGVDDPCDTGYIDAIGRASRRFGDKTIAPEATERIVSARAEPPRDAVLQNEPELSVFENVVTIAHSGPTFELARSARLEQLSRPRSTSRLRLKTRMAWTSDTHSDEWEPIRFGFGLVIA